VAALRQDTLVAYVEPDQEDSVPRTHLIGTNSHSQTLGPMGALPFDRLLTHPSAGAGVVRVDRAVSLSVTQQMDANGDPWGLDRIDQRALPLSGTYTYTSTGAGVHVYIMDSGIWTAHPDFEGRADIVYDYAGGDGQDCWGHGTLVAGIVGAATYGVAKGVYLHGVRVWSADCVGSFNTSDLVAGVDWVTANHRSPAVANLLSPSVPSTALATAVQKLWDSGVFVATTAGNDNADACQRASGQTPFAVAASTKADAKADFSNWGQCVKIYAPGENIQSTWLNGRTSIETGTSFAAPHVAGVAALYKGTFGDASSDVVANWILNNATAGVITGNPPGTPNLLLYSPTGPVPPPPGSLKATTSTSGSNLPTSGYTVTVDGTTSQAIGINDSVTFSGLSGNSSHSVVLSGVPGNCTVGGGSSQTVTVPSGGTATVPFAVGCTTPNTPPTVDAGPNASVVLGLGYTESATFSDPDNDGPWSYTIAWGDGSSSTGSTSSQGTITAMHDYFLLGSYTITVTVVDSRGASGSASKVLTVTM
jgi:subtilisin family serine protease